MRRRFGVRRIFRSRHAWKDRGHGQAVREGLSVTDITVEIIFWRLFSASCGAGGSWSLHRYRMAFLYYRHKSAADAQEPF